MPLGEPGDDEEVVTGLIKHEGDFRVGTLEQAGDLVELGLA